MSWKTNIPPGQEQRQVYVGGNKQLCSSTRQHTCTSVIAGQKIPCQAQCDGYGASAIFPRLVTAILFLVSATEKCFEMKRIASAEEDAAKAKRALTEVSKNGF
jgi:hypothetical protein